MPLRILLDARHIRDFGFGTYIRNVVRAYATLGTPHTFLLSVHKADAGEFSRLPDNFETIVYERNDSEPIDQVAFPLFARAQRPDLVHIPLNVVPALLPRPYVVTVHDLSALVFDAPTGWKHELRRFQIRRGLLRAERVVAVSETTRHDVISLLGIPPERVKRIYGAVDPRFTAPVADSPEGEGGSRAMERSRVLERYQIQYPFLLYSGTIRPQKNIPRLVEAFALLRGELRDDPELKDLRLIIIGDEISLYPSVRKAVIQSRVEPFVRFLGFVSIDTLRVFYEAAKAFVFPSLYEGFGLPPLEAMASGTPVVCSGATSLPEAVGDAAIMVNPENVFDIARGMREVLYNNELRAEMVARGRQRVSHFRWLDTARELLEVYETAAGLRTS
jgi:glycosyltransferase involved in cell wall biosynthesis